MSKIILTPLVLRFKFKSKFENKIFFKYLSSIEEKSKNINEATDIVYKTNNVNKLSHTQIDTNQVLIN